MTKEAVKRATGRQVRTPVLEVDGEWNAEPALAELKQFLEHWGCPPKRRRMIRRRRPGK